LAGECAQFYQSYSDLRMCSVLPILFRSANVLSSTNLIQICECAQFYQSYSMTLLLTFCLYVMCISLS